MKISEATQEYRALLSYGKWAEGQRPSVSRYRKQLLSALTVINCLMSALFILIMFFAVNGGCGTAYGAEITDEQAVRCIMGEARGEGYDGMLAHAEAIRNRGHLKGVYGCKAKFSEPEYVWAKARKAWKESEHTATVKGADHWGSIIVDRAWIDLMERKDFIHTATIKNTAFYKHP